MDERTSATAVTWAVSPWDDHGRAMLHAVAKDLTEVMTVTLNALLAISGTNNVVESGRSIPLRAERSDLDAVLLSLATLLSDELETGSVAAAVVDGLLRTDTGWVGWGRALLGDGATCREPIAIQGMPEITRGRDGEMRISALLVRDGEWAEPSCG